MIRNLFAPKILLVSALVILTVLPLARGSEAQHNVEKRQIGVLARTGALPQAPQGKRRSVEALARNGELPLITNNNKRDDSSNNQYIMDLLIQELAAAEGLSRLHLQALTERLLQQRQDAMEQENSFEDVDKRSVAALARGGGFPQKRSMEAMARSGYLIKPTSTDQQPDLLDPDDFLGKSDADLLDVNGGFDAVAGGKRGGLASLAKHGYIGKREGFDVYEDLDDDLDDILEDKRHIGAARNFLSDKRHVGSARNFLIGEGKRNLGSLRNFGKRNLASARNFGGKRNIGAARNFMDDKRNIGSFKNYLSGKRNVGSALRFLAQNNDKRNLGAARNFLEGKRNVGAARNFFLSGSKKNLGAARNFFYGKRNLASFARDGGFSSVKYPSSKNFAWDDEIDFDDWHPEEDKRYLGSFLRNQRYLGSVKGKRNLGSFRNFGKRFDDDEEAMIYYANDEDEDDEDLDELQNEEETAKEKRQVNGTVIEHEQHNKTRTKREAFIESPQGEYPMPVFQNSKAADYEDLLAAFADEESQNDVEKRFLGRIPQLGRVHQKTQSQPGRRRPQLRPNWL